MKNVVSRYLSLSIRHYNLFAYDASLLYIGTRIGCDITFIFKQSKAGLNSISFLLCWFYKPSLLNLFIAEWERRSYGSIFPRSINVVSSRYAFPKRINVVSSRWMIHREEWLLNIFIQHKYPVLMDTYKKTQYNKLQTINKRTYYKCCIAKRSKIRPNINQLNNKLSINCWSP